MFHVCKNSYSWTLLFKPQIMVREYEDTNSILTVIIKIVTEDCVLNKAEQEACLGPWHSNLTKSCGVLSAVKLKDQITWGYLENGIGYRSFKLIVSWQLKLCTSQLKATKTVTSVTTVRFFMALLKKRNQGGEISVKFHGKCSLEP